MPRGTLLSNPTYATTGGRPGLLEMLKSEVGLSLQVGIALDDDQRFKLLLSNKQTELASLYQVPWVKDRQDVGTVAGQRFYTLPGLDYDSRAVQKVEVRWNAIWTELTYGIDEEDYNISDSLLVPPMMNDPMLKWMVVGQVAMIPPTAVVLASQGVGLTGTYKYAYTTVTSQGESDISPLQTIAVTNKQILISGMNDVTTTVQGLPVTVSLYKNLYRTVAGGTSLYLDQVVPTGVSAVSDSVIDGALGVAAPEQTVDMVGLFEVWPVPASSSTVRFTGQDQLLPLVQNTDVCSLDDLLIVYGVASEEATVKERANARLLTEKFNRRLSQMMSSGPTKNSVFRIGQRSDRNNNRGPRKVLLG